MDIVGFILLPLSGVLASLGLFASILRLILRSKVEVKKGLTTFAIIVGVLFMVAILGASICLMKNIEPLFYVSFVTVALALAEATILGLSKTQALAQKLDKIADIGALIYFGFAMVFTIVWIVMFGLFIFGAI